MEAVTGAGRGDWDVAVGSLSEPFSGPDTLYRMGRKRWGAGQALSTDPTGIPEDGEMCTEQQGQQAEAPQISQ